jgi:hypothetical protein
MSLANNAKNMKQYFVASAVFGGFGPWKKLESDHWHHPTDLEISFKTNALKMKRRIWRLFYCVGVWQR